MISPMTFGESGTRVHPMTFIQNWRFCILWLVCLGMSFAAFSQGDPFVELSEKYDRDQRYFATIGGDSIEMNLGFDGTIHPEFASVYQWFGAVSGHYRWKGSEERVPLKGVLWNPDSLSLYVPDVAEDQSCWLDVPNPDSIAFWAADNSEQSVPVLEVFSLQPTGGLWKKGIASKPVQGIDFEAHGLQRTAVLEVVNANGVVRHVDVSELICQHVGLSQEEWVGYSGWAETDVVLNEFTFVEGGVNVLLAIDVSGSCNTDRSYLLAFQLDDAGAVGKAHLYQVYNCLFYGAEEGLNQSFNVVLHDAPEGGASPFADDSLHCIGAFQIVQSEVVVEKAWSGIVSRSPLP